MEQVAAAIAMGLSDGEIAQSLGITKRTVRLHVSKAFRRTD